MSTTKSVLIVDDDGFVRRALKRTLRDLPVEVLEAENGHQALTLLRQGLEPALIISDIDMPVVSGLELAEYVRIEFPHIPMILCSGGAYDMQVSALSRASLDAGGPGIEYLPKPTPPSVFKEKVRKLV